MKIEIGVLARSLTSLRTHLSKNSKKKDQKGKLNNVINKHNEFLFFLDNILIRNNFACIHFIFFNLFNDFVLKFLICNTFITQILG